MASEGPRSGGTFANDASVGALAWNSPGNALASDNVRSNCFRGTSGSVTSNYHKSTNFGFSIPAGATIDGIFVEFERLKLNSEVVDSAIRIVKGGVIGSTNKSVGASWPSTEAYNSFGGVSDLWGETWTPTDINDSGFGVVISATLTHMGSTVFANIDHVRITVHYTEAAAGVDSYTFRQPSLAQRYILVR